MNLLSQRNQEFYQEKRRMRGKMGHLPLKRFLNFIWSVAILAFAIYLFIKILPFLQQWLGLMTKTIQ